MEFSVSPMKLYEDYGIVTYNASTSGQPIEVTNFLINYIFEKGQKPQLIVLDVSSLFLKSGEAEIRYVSDNVGLSKYKLQLIKNYSDNSNSQGAISLDLKAQVKDALSFVIPFYKYHTRWDELSYSDFFSNNSSDYFLQGFYACPSIDSSTWTTMRHDSVQKVASDLGVDFWDLNYEDLRIDWKHDTRDGDGI